MKNLKLMIKCITAHSEIKKQDGFAFSFEVDDGFSIFILSENDPTYKSELDGNSPWYYHIELMHDDVDDIITSHSTWNQNISELYNVVKNFSDHRANYLDDFDV